MADWKTYVKAAQNTAKKQAPGAKQAVQDSAGRARRSAEAYATVAGRTAQRAGVRAKEQGLGGKIARAFRDALLIGGSLLVIWGVLYAAGLPIPFSAVIIAVLIIVIIAFASSLYANTVRKRRESAEDDEERGRGRR